MDSKIDRRRALRVLGMLVVIATGSWLPAQTLSNYSQLSVMIGATSIQDTEWGSVDVNFVGAPGLLYFNLAVNAQWAVQNLPVVSNEGAGVPQTVTVTFNLGVPRGTNIVGGIHNVAFSLTPATVMMPPMGAAPTVVASGSRCQSGGSLPGLGFLPFAPFGIFVPGFGLPPSAGHTGFPNQDCGTDECTPAAVSNSLMFLKSKNPSPAWGALPVDIMTMKTATNWGFKAGAGATGAWIDPDPTRPAGEMLAWWQSKDAYMMANGYPVKTTKTTMLSDILAAVMAGKDVEIQGDWHTAAVVGATDMGNGFWVFQVAHDTKQGPAGNGGTRTETIIYNPTTMMFVGSPGFFAGSSFRYAVIECFQPPAL